MKRIVVACLTVLCSGTFGAAQDSDPWVRLKLRVTSVSASGEVVVDRGSRDRVEKGDVVFLYPREGGHHRADIVAVNERTTTVRLRDPSYKPEPGMRGEVVYRKTRLDTPRTPKAGETAPAGPEKTGEAAAGKKPGGQESPDKPGFKNKDDKWKPGMPLLATVRPVRPEEREPRIVGRAYAMGELTRAKGQGWSNSFIRGGTDITYENMLGYGGEFRLNVEANYKKETNWKSGTDVLLRRLSYRWGGTRFEESGWELGRFLMSGTPEFGVLDGVEWNRRVDQHRYGFSAGMLPTPLEDFDTGADLHVGGHYEWAADLREQLTLGVAAQATWHHGASDRNLVVMKARYFPDSGWNGRATLWVDFYTGKDDYKDKWVEITQAIISSGRALSNGGNVEFTFEHRRFPEIRRHEFTRPDFDKIDNNRYDRLAFDGDTPIADQTRLRGHMSGWVDEDDQGLAAEVGIEFEDAILDNSRLTLAAFGALADQDSVPGVRVAFSQFGASAHWDLFYEIGHHHAIGFLDRDDLIQHRLRLSTGFQLTASVDVSLHGEVRVWDDDVSWTTGFFIQKNF